MVSSILPVQEDQVPEDAKLLMKMQDFCADAVAPISRDGSLLEVPMSDINVVNPGLVNVANEADGEILINQTITVAKPSTNSGPLTQGANLAPGRGVATTDPSDVTPPMTAQRSVNGGTASPVSPNTIDAIQNTVVNQPSSVQQFAHTINVSV